MIPRNLFRTVPETTTAEVEGYWAGARELHPGWELVTLRDPIDEALFPLTAGHWPLCSSGAQRAGLIRLEALYRWGGFYLDSDVECYRPLDPLLGSQVVAGWEDPNTVPDAVLGAAEGHPVIGECIALALERLESSSENWRDGAGAWSTGPGVLTTILPYRAGVLLLPPGSFYPHHWTQRERGDEDHRHSQPWAFCCHKWAASWV